MDWQKVYNTIIQNAQRKAKKRVRNRRKNNSHVHHIHPYYLGGAYIEKRELKDHERHDDLVILTYREHYIAHMALYAAHEKNRGAQVAFWRCEYFGDGSSRKYARWREERSHARMSKRHREKIRKAALARPDRFEHSKKMHAIQKSQPITFTNRKRPEKYRHTRYRHANVKG